MLICGIDEAGRGPCLGPLVICGVTIKEEDEYKLKTLGVKDSKLLSPRVREELFDEIKKYVHDFKIIIVEPAEIDDAVEKKDGLNLNWLEAAKSIELINSLKPDRSFVDCPSTNTKAYRERLESGLKTKSEIIAEHKADVKYPVVSAASILAKVVRDREIAKLRDRYGDIGSGYPADEVTQKFLKENYLKHPEIFRKSWSCYKKLITGAGQKKLEF
jgi:ribonuclease HII